MNLFDELRRRKVFKVGGAYLVVAWLAVQAASIAFPAFAAPSWVLRVFILVALLGFPLVLVLAWAVDATHEGLRLDPAIAGTRRVVAGAALLVLVAIGWFIHGQPAFRESDRTTALTSPPAAPAAPASAPAVDPHSIAVLPFVDMSQDKDQEYFSDGLSEELLNLLAQLPQLRVIARTSSFSFKGRDVDVGTIARALHVANVLEGSVRKSGNTLRITAQLIRASDSTHLWSQTYDRELTDVFKVQDEIAGAVVSALKVQLLPDQAMTNTHRSDDAEAYNQFLLGNELLKRDDEVGWRGAIDAFHQAIAHDGGFAAAYAGLANAECSLADRLGDQAQMAQAVTDATKAIKLAPDLADGYSSRAIARLSYQRDWAGGAADLEKSLALSPGDSDVHVNYARLMIALGRTPEALASTRRSVELDPLSSVSWSQLGRILNFVGKYQEAKQALDRSLDFSPTCDTCLFHRGMTELLQGRAAESVAYFRKAAGGYGGAGVAMAEHTLGHARESQQALDAEIAGFSQGAAYQIAEVYAWRGERDKAFQWLDRAYVQNDGGLTFIKMDPLLTPIADDPRFAALLKKLGLPK